jgi:hypothetical protein
MLGANLALFLGWYFSLGKTQVKYVRDYWQDRYQRKSWPKPLLIYFGCVVGWLVAFAILAVIAKLLFGLQ